MSEERISLKAAEYRESLERDAADSGYRLNPDRSLVSDLAQGLVTNIERYGYAMCPCRLAFGDKAKDIDVICPCDYRDADIAEYGSCYCGLYVGPGYVQGAGPVPERRPESFQFDGFSSGNAVEKVKKTGALTVWRCRVCGYLCAREAPPGKCPICKASSERFEEFSLT